MYECDASEEIILVCSMNLKLVNFFKSAWTLIELRVFIKTKLRSSCSTDHVLGCTATQQQEFRET